MKINNNGIVREMNAGELAEYERMAASIPKPCPSPEERIALLEADNAALKEALELLLSGVTDDA